VNAFDLGVGKIEGTKTASGNIKQVDMLANLGSHNNLPFFKKRNSTQNLLIGI